MYSGMKKDYCFRQEKKFTVDRDIKHLFLTNLVIYMMYMEASWQIYNCVINSNISFDKGSISFGEWWCLQVPHQVDGGKNAHPLRFHSMTDSVERKRIKTWSHQIISTCFFIFFSFLSRSFPRDHCAQRAASHGELYYQEKQCCECVHTFCLQFLWK